MNEELHYHTLGELAVACNIIAPTPPAAVWSFDELVSCETPYELIVTESWLNWDSMIVNYIMKTAVGGNELPNYLGIAEELRSQSNEISVLLKNYVFPRLWNQWVFFDDRDLLPEAVSSEQSDELKDFVQRVGAWLSMTYIRYAPRIQAMVANKTKLMDKVANSAETKLNEAPQTPYVAGETDGDDHLTNVTKTDASDDAGTKMSRIAEIDLNIKSAYEEWAKEFENSFVLI